MRKWNHNLVLMSVLLLLLGFCAQPGRVQAQTTHTVDGGGGGDFTTIQAAINAADPGDTILVGPGEYEEGVRIDKALTVISRDGAAVTSIVANLEHVVGIQADEVTFGAPDQGFTVGSGAIPALLRVDGALAGAETVIIQNNVFLGCETSSGVEVWPPLKGSHLVVQNNVFENDECDYSFRNAIAFGFGNDEDVGQVSAHSATIDLLSNTVTDFDRTAVYFSKKVYNSVVNINPSSFTAVDTPSGATYGIRFNSSVEVFSSVSISGTTISNVDYGVYVNGEIWALSDFSVTGCDVLNYDEDGLYIYSASYESTLVIDDNDLTADPASGNETTGIWFDNGPYYDGTYTINNNRITEFNYAGIYTDDDAEDNATFNITGNTLTAVGTGAYYGIYLEECWGTRALVNSNTVSGFTDSGLYLDLMEWASDLTVDGNTFTAHADGADHGLYVSDHFEQSSATINGNTFTGFTSDGIYTGDVKANSDVAITGNTVTAHSGGASSGIYIYKLEKDSEVLINPNTVTGWTSYGLYIYLMKEGATLTVDGNTFEAHPDGGSYGLYISDNISTSTANITGNTFTGFTTYGIDPAKTEKSGRLNITGNTITAHANGGFEGISMDGVTHGSQAVISGNRVSGYTSYGFYTTAIHQASTLTMAGNTFTADPEGAGEGIYLDYNNEASITENSTASITGNTVSGFTSNGLYVEMVALGSVFNFDNNIMTAHPDGAGYGYYNSEGFEQSSATISGNTFTGFDSYGIYLYDVKKNSDVAVTGNTLTAHSGGASYGIYVDDIEKDSELLINPNTVTGWTDTGLYIYNMKEGSQLTVDGNTFEAHPEGGSYGMYIYDAINASTATITGNTFAGFTTYGMYGGKTEKSARLNITGNTFTAHAEGASRGIYLYGVVHGSEAVVNDNTISGFTSRGFYTQAIHQASMFTMAGNTLTAHPEGATYGIYLDSDSGAAVHENSTASITGNTVSGFTDYGLYSYGSSAGSTLDFSDNRLTAHADGALYGLYNYYVVEGAAATINDNRITGIRDSIVTDNGDSRGMWLQEVQYGSTLEVCGNTVTAHPEGSAYGIYNNNVPRDGSALTLCDNVVSGFDNTTIYFKHSGGSGSSLDILNNSLNGSSASRGIHFQSSLEDAMVATIAGNLIAGFDRDGIKFSSEITGSHILIEQNRFIGGGLEDDFEYEDGIDFNGSINGGSTVDIRDNCFQDVPAGVQVVEIEDTSWVSVNDNDFSGVTETGIENEESDADHPIDGTNNWWGSAAGAGGSNPDVLGEVDADPALAGEPDTDRDGVPACEDLCPDTPAGQRSNGEGCSCLQLDPDGDDDGDGTLNCNDGCQDDSAKVVPGACGCGTPDVDTDRDGVPDCNDADLDGDGVDDAIEESAPNRGDANGDGTPDRFQANVTSVPDTNTNFATVVAPQGTSLSNVVATDNPSPVDTPADVEFPVGFFNFDVQGVSRGGAIEVEIIVDLPEGAVLNTYWKFGPTPDNPTPHWYEFLFDGTTGAEINGNVITLHLVDGQRGDGDLRANGVIVDPGAPAFQAIIPDAPPEAPPEAPQATPGADPGLQVFWPLFPALPFPICGIGLCGPGSLVPMGFMVLGFAGLKARTRRQRRR